MPDVRRVAAAVAATAFATASTLAAPAHAGTTHTGRCAISPHQLDARRSTRYGRQSTPVYCPIRAEQAPGIGPVRINDQGGVDVADEPVWDCPPYDVEWQRSAAVRAALRP